MNLLEKARVATLLITATTKQIPYKAPMHEGSYLIKLKVIHCDFYDRYKINSIYK